VRIPGAGITSAGLHSDVSVALQYLEAWLRGSGAVAINNMMEDTATAEIARAQLWQWVRHGARTEEGLSVTLERVRELLEEETRRLAAAAGPDNRLAEAATLLDSLVSAREFPEFLTLGAYEKLE
jgi:malate synthase